MMQKLIFFIGFTLVAGFVSSYSWKELKPTKLCTWTRCPYYEAPPSECNHYSDIIPNDMISKVIQDTDEGLILASECVDVP
jgi:hypothetical protein